MSNKDLPNEDLFKQIDEVLKVSPENRPSYYQLKYFVIGKEPTNQSKMWQCLRELKSRKETIDNLICEINDLGDDLLLISINIEKENLDKPKTKNKHLEKLSSKELEIKIRKLKRREEKLKGHLVKLGEKLEYSIQEARFFFQSFKSLEKSEKLKDYDDFDAQNEYWEAKISEEVNLKLLSRQGLGVDLIKTALAMPTESPVKLEMGKIISNFINQSLPKKDINDKQTIERESKL